MSSAEDYNTESSLEPDSKFCSSLPDKLILKANSYITNKELGLFFLINLIFSCFFGFFSQESYRQQLGNTFFLNIMYTPAISAMIVFWMNKEKRKKLAKEFFAVYIMGFLLTVAAPLFLQEESLTGFLSIKDVIWAIVLLVTLGIYGEKTKFSGLGFPPLLKRMLLYGIIFAGTNLTYLFVERLISKGTGALPPDAPFFYHLHPNTPLFIALLPLFFFLAMAATLGEEYGWRYFLQKALQHRLGPRKGALLTGFFWGLWHLPLILFLSNGKENIGIAVISSFIGCAFLAGFYALAVMRSKTVWTAVLIHFWGNFMGQAILLTGVTDAFYNPSAQSEYLMDPGPLSSILQLLFGAALYLPFLLSKKYTQAWKEYKDA